MEKSDSTENQDDSQNCKVVMIGETAVGKTCLITRYVKQEFQENFVPTLGGTFSIKEETYVQLNQTLRLQIWDTAGQEKYRSVNKLFYSDANIIMFVYDITRKETFEEIKNYWCKQAEELAPLNSLKIIVGNKSDLYEFEDVPETEVKKYAEENNMLFFTVSAKTATGVNKLFHQAGKKVLDSTNEEDMTVDNLRFPSIKGKHGKETPSIMLESRLNLTSMKKSKKKCC